MRLHELIVKLQAVEKTSPEVDVAFRHADIHRQSRHELHLLEIAANGEGCLIVLGDYEGEGAAYKEWQDALRKSQGR